MSQINPAELQDTAAFIEYVKKQYLPSAYGTKVTDGLEEVKTLLFSKLLHFAQTSGTSYDSVIVFEDFLEEIGRVYNEVQAAFIHAQIAKETERPEQPLVVEHNA